LARAYAPFVGGRGLQTQGPDDLLTEEHRLPPQPISNGCPFGGLGLNSSDNHGLINSDVQNRIKNHSRGERRDSDRHRGIVAEREAVERTAWSAPGITSVDNRIVVFS
jgi:hypothetical protein